MMRSVTLPDGQAVPALGLGTWRLGEQASRRPAERDALRRGLDLGLQLIDTAEIYADGGAETVVGEAIAGRRDDVFLVSKLHPRHATRAAMAQACEASLRRLGTDRLDLYLLHWRGSTPLAETVAAFEALRAAGRILRWGVSNFDLADMEELAALGGNCATNQVLYNPAQRGIEFDLLPWQRARRMPIMAYSPLGQGGLLGAAALRAVAARHGATPAQIALAWSLRDPDVMSIPKAADERHLAENAAAADIVLTPEDLATIDAEFPPPRRKAALGVL